MEQYHNSNIKYKKMKASKNGQLNGFQIGNKWFKNRRQGKKSCMPATKLYKRSTKEHYVGIEESATGAFKVSNIDDTLVADACYLRPKDEANRVETFYEKYMQE